MPTGNVILSALPIIVLALAFLVMHRQGAGLRDRWRGPWRSGAWLVIGAVWLLLALRSAMDPGEAKVWVLIAGWVSGASLTQAWHEWHSRGRAGWQHQS